MRAKRLPPWSSPTPWSRRPTFSERFRDLGRRGLLPQRILKDIELLTGKQSTNVRPPRPRLGSTITPVKRLVSSQVPRFASIRMISFCGTACAGRGSSRPTSPRKSRSFSEPRPELHHAHEELPGRRDRQLEGQTNLPCWDKPLPLWVSTEKPPDVRRSPYLAFRNGLVNVASALGGDGVPRGGGLTRGTSRKWRCPTGSIRPPTAPSGNRRSPSLSERGRERSSDRGAPRIHGLVPAGRRHAVRAVPDPRRPRLQREVDGHAGLAGDAGADNVSHVPLEELESQFRLVQMAGKLANMAADMNYVGRVAEGRLKELVSGDAIQVNRKHREPITMVPTAKLVFSCNHLPQFADRSDGIWRRLIVIPFLRQFGDDDKDLDRVRRLRDELPRIFNWCLRGTRRLDHQGDFTVAAGVCGRIAESPSPQLRSVPSVRRGANSAWAGPAAVAAEWSLRRLSEILRDQRPQAGQQQRVQGPDAGTGWCRANMSRHRPFTSTLLHRNWHCASNNRSSSMSLTASPRPPIRAVPSKTWRPCGRDLDGAKPIRQSS